MIKPVTVERDSNGYWSHPDFFPNDDREIIPKDEWQQWQWDNCIKVFTLHFEDDADEELIARYWSDGDLDISGWEPACTEDTAFLLSIMDTEDGPIALFAIPVSVPCVVRGRFGWQSDPCGALSIPGTNRCSNHTPVQQGNVES